MCGVQWFFYYGLLLLLALSDITSRGLLASALGLAILFYGGTSQILQLGVITLLMFGVFARLSWSVRHQKIYWSKAHAALAFYSIYLIGNIYLSVFAENTLQVAWLFLVLPMAVLVCGRPNDEYWKILLPLLCIPMSFSIFWGFTEFFLTTGRSSGPVIDPNSWASGLNLFFFVLAAWFFKAGGRTASMVFILLGCCAAGVFMAYSRVGSLIFGISFAFVTILALSLPAYRRRGLVLLLLVVAAFSAVNGYRSSEQATKHSEGYTLNVQSVGWSQRLAQWRSGLSQAQDYPIAGSGLGTFKVLYPTYRTLEDARTAGNYVHNDYIQLLAEGGPLLLLFVVTAIAFLFWHFLMSVWKVLKHHSIKDAEIAILIVALGTVFVHSTMNFSLYILVNQLIMGCVLARILWLIGYCRETQFSLNSPGLARLGLVFSLVYILAINVADAVSHDLVYQGGRIPLDRNNPKHQLMIFDTLSTIRQFRSGNSANRFAMAIFYRTSFDDQPATNIEARRSLALVTTLEYQRGLELNPYSVQTRKFFADFLIENPWLMEIEGVYQSPEKILRDSLALAPFQIHRHVVLADYLQSINRGEEAYDILRNALVYAPMRYAHFEEWRTTLYVRLLKEAKQRGDAETLQMLYETVGTS